MKFLTALTTLLVSCSCGKEVVRGSGEYHRFEIKEKNLTQLQHQAHYRALHLCQGKYKKLSQEIIIVVKKKKNTYKGTYSIHCYR